ncbi:MAG: hypothetical protein RMM31_09920 [Anaerolineae bacterium]|nr:hypothetical protein [Thermoflexales bacterium]MDW8396544.1 hypothetical protein [Anaerolineae bacterium]
MAFSPRQPSSPDDWEPTGQGLSGQWEEERIQRQTVGGLAAAWNDPRTRPLLLISGLALLGIVGLGCFIVVLVLLSGREARPEVPDRPVAVETATIQAAITESVVLQANDTPIPSAVPTRLTLRERMYELVPVQLSGDRWRFDPKAERTGYWLPGTLVNYVIGLPPTEENRLALDELRSEALIVLETSSGVQRFRVSQKETLNEADLVARLSQDSPRLTLILLGEGSSRLVVTAQFTDEATPNQLTTLNTPINLGDVRVTAINHRLLPGSTVNLPPGQNYYQVDFVVVGLLSETQVLDAAQFFTELRDASGNAYPLSRQASSAAGALGFTAGALQNGMVMTATAGFEVPDTLTGPTLEWRFAISRDTPYVARVALPYRAPVVVPTPQPTPALVAEITILNANISPDGTELRVVGLARNLTNTFLPGSLRDVSLKTPDGQLVPINSTLPAFPWSITPGETLAFQISFVRPPGSGPVTFTLYGQSFEISGF